MSHTGKRIALAAALAVPGAIVATTGTAHAATGLTVQSVQWDLATPTTLGVQVLIAGDDDFDATVDVRYRVANSGAAFTTGPALFRVHPELVHDPAGPTPAQFAGSIFNLTPNTPFEVQLTATDEGSTVDVPASPVQTTAAFPANPAGAGTVTVHAGDNLQSALAAAHPGTVVDVQPGTYSGPFTLPAGGTPTQPITLRGTGSAATDVVLTGTDSASILDLFGGYVQVRNLTLRHGKRGIRVLGNQPGGPGTAVTPNRGVSVIGARVEDTLSGIVTGYNPADGLAVTSDVTQSVICNNVLQGRVAEGEHYDDTPGADNTKDTWVGIQVGSGSVVCDNKISGHGDAMAVTGFHTRAVDFYGNDVLWSYDNAVETDHSAGNVRVYGNRFLNTHAAISFQPVLGGPVYAMRNVVVNSFREHLKLHNDDGGLDNASGLIIANNTFDKAGTPLVLATDTRSSNFEIINNVFLGGGGPTRTIDWTPGADWAWFNANAYNPNTTIRFAGQTYPNLAAFSAATGFEQRGIAIGPDALATLAPWPAWTTFAGRDVDASLSTTSPARNAARPLGALNAVPDGLPDIGALELGCPLPVYGQQASLLPYHC